jgi:hypothetical protein
MIADAERNTAVLEFVGGGDVSIVRSSDPWQVSTNFLLTDRALEYARGQCWRYRTAYDALAEAQGAMTDTDAMGLLRSTSQGSTVWSMVYNMTTRDIHVVMEQNDDEVMAFSLE